MSILVRACARRGRRVSICNRDLGLISLTILLTCEPHSLAGLRN